MKNCFWLQIPTNAITLEEGIDHTLYYIVILFCVFTVSELKRLLYILCNVFYVCAVIKVLAANTI